MRCNRGPRSTCRPSRSTRNAPSTAKCGRLSPVILGGELGRVRPGHGSLAWLDADYMLFAVGSTPVWELAGPAANA